MSNAVSGPSSDTRPNFPRMEEEIAQFWTEKNIFVRSIEERSETNSYVFYDGPPFATGMPHIGHLLQSTIKDAVPRYFTMQGYRVPRRWGWDCHGLPMEAKIQKELKLSSKKEIEEYGIGAFNEQCASSVLLYANEWRRYVERIGRWVDMDGAYKTMDTDFIESVWWAFAELWKKQLIYKDLRVSMYSPSNGTPLSNFEVAMENSYIEAEDPSIIVKFKVKDEENVWLLAWTTTPWTLPANVGLAVHPDQVYVKAKVSTGETYILAEALLSSVFRSGFSSETSDYEITGRCKGSDLVGVSYEPLYVFSSSGLDQVTARAGEKCFEVVAMDYVSMTDGTGIVHTAPAFGEEDFSAAKKYSLPVLVTLDEAGNQLPVVPLVAGVSYEDSNPMVIADLEKRELLYRSEKITHSVAIFARNNTRLIYKAQPAWYVDIAKLRPKLLETAKKIHWHPEHLKEGRFGKGLETAPDWCISRSRFWGAPLPVWTNADGSDVCVFSSIAELEKAAGVKIDRKHSLNLHRPAIDGIVFTNEQGQEMRRIPEVFDCWFESGSMSFASRHYPLENRDFFEANSPADFIAEAQDQTRGWFYTLHVMSTALFGKPAFKNVICTGLVMAEDGKKMSKSLKNYTDPFELMTTLGADALRLYLLSSPVVQAEQLNFSERDCATLQRTLLGTLWNVRAFYLLYAGGDVPEIKKPRSTHLLDRWLLARLMVTLREMTDAMERYDLVAAIRPLRSWVDDFSTWWLRRSRERMKGTDEYDRVDALRTLREALLETSLLLAPFAPFFAEKLYQDVNGPKMSVHLDRWSKVDERVIDERLLEDMAWAREVVAAGHEARVAAKIPVRQALASVTLAMKDAAEASRLGQRADLLMIIRDELNVERVLVHGGVETDETAWTVTLDTVLTPELKKKGLARELARQLMNMRKALQLSPQDRIHVSMAVVDPGMRDTIESLIASLAEDVKASAMDVGNVLPEIVDARERVQLDATEIEIALRKV